MRLRSCFALNMLDMLRSRMSLSPMLVAMMCGGLSLSSFYMRAVFPTG